MTPWPGRARARQANKKPFRPKRTKGHTFRGTTSVRRALCAAHSYPSIPIEALRLSSKVRCNGRARASLLVSCGFAGHVLWQNHSGRHSALGLWGGSQPVTAFSVSAPRTRTLPGGKGMGLWLQYTGFFRRCQGFELTFSPSRLEEGESSRCLRDTESFCSASLGIDTTSKLVYHRGVVRFSSVTLRY